MKCMFVGRRYELDMLQELTEKHSASLVVITGRRRIGKSRLVEEFASRSKRYRHIFISALPPQPKVTSQMQRRAFAEQMQAGLDLPPVESRSWMDLFRHLARATNRGRWIILLDEVSWMAASGPDFLPKLKVVWDQLFKKNPQLILVLCGSVSSWLDKNILSSTGFVGRVSLSLRLDELPLRHCGAFWGSAKRRVSAYDMLKILSITGGIPRYLEEIVAKQSVDQNIRRLCFSPAGLLFREFNQIFSSLFDRRAPAYRRIVAALAEGHTSMRQILEHINVEKSGVMGEYLDDLALAGFLQRDYTWDLRTRSTSKLSHYRLKDNYVRFYLKYILPNRRKIENKLVAQTPLSAWPGWDSVMGLQFENLVLQSRRFIWNRCGLSPSEIEQEGPFFQTATSSRRGCQIDYLIQTRHGPVYVCEIKFSRDRISAKIEKEMHEKLNRIVMPKHCSVIPILIHANEVSDTVAHGDCFAKIIDFTEIFKET